jgi:hypothetical protein
MIENPKTMKEALHSMTQPEARPGMNCHTRIIDRENARWTALAIFLENLAFSLGVDIETEIPDE